MRQQLIIEDFLKDFVNGRPEADGAELPWVCLGVGGGGVCGWTHYYAEPILGERLNTGASIEEMWEF